MKYPPRECDAPLIVLVRMGITLSSRVSRDDIIGDICCSIPSAHVQALYAIGPPVAEPDFWRRTLGHLRGLRYMKLSDGYMPDLAPLLALPPDESSVTPKGHGTSGCDLTRDYKLATTLKELQLCRIYGFESMDENKTYQKSLLDVLSIRKVRLTINNRIGVEDESHSTDDDDDDPSFYAL